MFHVEQQEISALQTYPGSNPGVSSTWNTKEECPAELTLEPRCVRVRRCARCGMFRANQRAAVRSLHSPSNATGRLHLRPPTAKEIAEDLDPQAVFHVEHWRTG